MDIILTLLVFAVLSLIMLFANLAERDRQAGRPTGPSLVMTYGSLGLLYLGLFGVGILLQLAGVLVNSATFSPEDLGEMSSAFDEMALFLEALPLLGFSLWFPSLMALGLLLPPVRRGLARLLPLDPASHVHAAALALIPLTLINLFSTLAIGLDTLAGSLAVGSEADRAGNLLATLWAQQLGTAFLAFVGVGLGVRRSWPATLARLKLVWPTQYQLGVGLALGLVLVPLVAGMEFLGSELGWSNADVEALSEQLLGPLLSSIGGVLTIGLSAALGEDLIFRGALQPHFGRWATAALFALAHSQYGLSLATIAVLLLGYVLGYIRDRHNTTTAMAVHAVYNLTLGAIAYFGSGLV